MRNQFVETDKLFTFQQAFSHSFSLVLECPAIRKATVFRIRKRKMVRFPVGSYDGIRACKFRYL